jgi:beta-phosphoglucomutase
VSGLQGVVFDFDGVLANSEPLHLRAYQSVLSQHGVALSAQEYYELYVGYDDETVFRAIARDRGIPAGGSWIEGVIREKTTAVQELLARNSPLFPGASASVRALAARVPVAVCSGAMRHEIVQVLEAGGLLDAFTAIVAAGETPRGKPAPDPYRRAVELMGAAAGLPLEPSRVAAVEDTVQGLVSARAAGLCLVAVTTTFRPETFEDAALVLPDISAVTYDGLNALWARSTRDR